MKGAGVGEELGEKGRAMAEFAFFISISGFLITSVSQNTYPVGDFKPVKSHQPVSLILFIQKILIHSWALQTFITFRRMHEL